ncbi:MAG: hypothetical protein ACRC4W_08145 [Treponemataceae bacterium]
MTNKTETGAKDYSLFSMVFAGVWICGWSIYKFLTTPIIEIDDIIKSGIAIAAVFSPVYFSIFIDKIKEKKF